MPAMAPADSPSSSAVTRDSPIPIRRLKGEGGEGEGGGDEGGEGGEGGGGGEGGSGHSKEKNPFVRGRTGGGRDGQGEKLSEAAVRGDRVAVLGEGEEERVGGLRAMLRQADELLAAMATGSAPALREVTSRSRPMLACYPGGGARYLTHLDNPGGAQANGRVLTLLVYLNPEWYAVRRE